MEFDLDSHKLVLTREQCKIMLLSKVGIKQTLGGYTWGGTENHRYNRIYKDLKLSVEFHTKNLKSTKRTASAERIYWVLNDIESYEQYPKCYCGKPVNFISLQRGYSKGCCQSHSTWRQVMDDRESKRNSGKTLSKNELRKIIKSKTSRMHIPTLYKSEDFVKSLELHMKDFPRRYEGLRQFQELCYAVSNNLKEPPKCKMCGNFRTFWNSARNYTAESYCSNKCRNDDKTVTQKLLKKFHKKNLKLYGTKEHPNAKLARLENDKKQKSNGYKTIIEKQKETCLKLYGVENKSMLPEVQEKAWETYYRHTGYRHPMHNPAHRDKLDKMMIEKYGTPVVGGTSTPKRHECGLSYQGSFELKFIETWLKFYKRENIENGPILKYKRPSDNNEHRYKLDFKIKDATGKFRLVEIKGSSRFFMYELHDGIFEQKMYVLLEHYLKNKKTYNPPILVFNKNKFYWLDSKEKIDNLVVEFKKHYLKSEYFTKGKSIFGLK